MAKAEPPRHVGRPDDVAREQLVDGLQRLALVDARSRGHHLRLERVARHRGALEHAPGTLGQQRELLRQYRQNEARDVDAID